MSFYNSLPDLSSLAVHSNWLYKFSTIPFCKRTEHHSALGEVVLSSKYNTQFDTHTLQPVSPLILPYQGPLQPF